jgi:hypothetical protein
VSRISPFVGLLFDRSVVGSHDLVTTPPYDVISEASRRHFLDTSPYNVIRLVLGRDDAGVRHELGCGGEAAQVKEEVRPFLEALGVVTVEVHQREPRRLVRRWFRRRPVMMEWCGTARRAAAIRPRRARARGHRVPTSHRTPGRRW